ncbi:MAG: N-acetyltransferase family protein, partial [Dialister sp.]|nr:GNAT family N-acetyltransferase [Dialister sp.]MDY2621901.1 N-acetyltransferase family protein [Dialister sp.]
SAFHTRPAYDWNVETSIYIAEDARHTGAGRKLYEALETYLRAEGIVTLYACITYPATPDPYVDTNSVDFHSHMGYGLVANFKKSGYKFDRWYDVVWMEKEIGAHRAPMAPVKRFAEILDQ